ncbi:MAG TPA: response regulator [Clostridiaceae bacterium]
MIVDDEPFVILGLEALINWHQYGFEVCCVADNGIDAFEKAKNFKPNLIITDIKMPEMDGLELIKRCIGEQLIDSKYIILTGFSNFEYARSAMRYGVYNFILKPVDEDEIINTLNIIKEELDLKKQKIFNEFDYRDFTGKMLKKFIDGKLLEKKLGKIKKYVPEYKNGEFIYVILQAVKCKYSQVYYEADIYEILKEIKKVILNINGVNKTLFFLQENIGLGIVVSKSMLDNQNYSLMPMLQMVIDIIFEKMGTQAILYIGKTVRGIPLIKESRDSCITTVNTNFLLSRKGIVSYETIKDIIFNYSGKSNELFEELTEAVEKNNLNKINENIEIICTNFQVELIAPEIIKADIASFELEVIKLITNMNGDVKHLASSVKRLQLNFMVISDIKEELKNFCNLASKYMNSIRETKKSGILYEVKKYININYSQDIRLKDISKHFYINTIYLGQIFKKKFGVSFNDYLNDYRITKAKELLESKKYKISEISTMVGYNDANYFISKFEKITCVTPAEYKKYL